MHALNSTSCSIRLPMRQTMTTFLRFALVPRLWAARWIVIDARAGRAALATTVLPVVSNVRRGAPSFRRRSTGTAESFTR